MGLKKKNPFLGIYLPALALRQKEMFGYTGVHSFPRLLRALGLLIQKGTQGTPSLVLFYKLSLHIKQLL